MEGKPPMTKNEASAHQTVAVLSQDGEHIGLTYHRRAAGLVKKGRARYVNDSMIRLESVSDAEITEDIKMDNINTLNENKPVQEQPVNRLYFNAREWSFNKDCQKSNVGNRSFMQGPDGTISEAFMIGDWGYNWTEIVTKQLILPKKTLHTFTFWLNGGENDNNNEVCRFEIVFNNEYEERYTFNLNRSFIRPLKKVNGWELYEIPFMTADNEYTQLRFVAQRAYMTVMTAKPIEEYAALPDTVDEFESERPQRHNIIFADGWPTNTWYSTKALREKHNKTANVPEKREPSFHAAEELMTQAHALNGIVTFATDEISKKLDGISGLYASLGEEIGNAVSKAISGRDPGDIDIDDICSDIMDKFSDQIDNITDEISSAIYELNGAVQDMSDSIEDMNDND